MIGFPGLPCFGPLVMLDERVDDLGVNDLHDWLSNQWFPTPMMEILFGFRIVSLFKATLTDLF